MSGAVILLPLYAFMLWTSKDFTFTFTTLTVISKYSLPRSALIHTVYRPQCLFRRVCKVVKSDCWLRHVFSVRLSVCPSIYLSVRLPVWSNSFPTGRIFTKFNWSIFQISVQKINPLNPELNPICCLLALLGVHHFLHVSRIRVKSLTLRVLMSYMYYYYLAGCTTFPHLPAPVEHLKYLLFPFVSVIPVFFHQSLFPHQSSNPFQPSEFRSTSFPSAKYVSLMTTCQFNTLRTGDADLRF